MAVSTTATFSLDIDDLLDAAFRRVGSLSPVGYDVDAGRRAFALLLYTLSVKNICLWQQELATPIELSQGVASYALPADTIDVLAMNVIDTAASDPTELPISRISLEVYHAFPDKTLESQPTQIFVHRGRGAPTIYLYPTPPSDDWELRYWRLVKPRDPGALINQPDVPVKWYPALVSGLAWFLARENPKVPLDLRQVLGDEWTADFDAAAAEDRDASPIEFDLDLSHINRPFGR